MPERPIRAHFPMAYSTRARCHISASENCAAPSSRAASTPAELSQAHPRRNLARTRTLPFHLFSKPRGVLDGHESSNRVETTRRFPSRAFPTLAFPRSFLLSDCFAPAARPLRSKPLAAKHTSFAMVGEAVPIRFASPRRKYVVKTEEFHVAFPPWWWTHRWESGRGWRIQPNLVVEPPKHGDEEVPIMKNRQPRWSVNAMSKEPSRLPIDVHRSMRRCYSPSSLEGRGQGKGT